MGKIVLLDELTINQIAAGEVIERPASVIKELVENSIDAGAKNITVDIKNGGISYIRVTDDGSGIMPDDMEIAFERHATSKIRKAEDLDEVKSMGFRGEALASIAAIAKVDMISKTEENDVGFKIIVEGGEILDKHEEGAPKGTSITIKELFFNTPVRYKFLKKDFTESGYIEDIITRIALANPGVAIKLINSGKTIIQTKGSGKIEDCIYSIFGKEIYDNILPVDYEYEDYHVTGVIGKPIISRSNRTNQLFFINKRFVKDKTLTSAAEQGFKGLVTIGKHGFLILNIDMDPKKVDVNVHPTKLEVRFQEESKIFKAIYHSIKETLLKSDLVSDPVKDYNDVTPNDILKEIKNKDRVQAWGLNKENASSQNTNQQDVSKSDQSAITTIKPEFNEFKSAITGLDAETRENLINEITKAKTTEEIISGIGKFSDLVNKDKNTKNNETTKIEETTEAEEKVNEKVLVENDSIEEKKIEDDTTEKLKENIDLSSEIKSEEKSEDKKEENTEEKVEKEKDEKIEEQKVESTEQQEELEKLPFEEMYKKLFGRDIETAKKEYSQKIQEDSLKYEIKPIGKNDEISMFENGEANNIMPYTYVGIAFKTYIILTMNNELYILDQHAAHERIMYEKVKANYFNDTEKDSQLMLLPDIINLSNKEMGIFKDNKELFNRAGFVVDEFGDNTVKLTGVPEFCLDFDTKEIFIETLDEIDTVARTAKQELEDKFLATVACKAAVKAHMALNKQEVDSLMKQLLKLPNPFSCPHGRPTVIKMTKNDIEKKFSRR